MVLFEPVIEKNTSKIRFKFKISNSKLPEFLWFEVDKKYESYISNSLDSALVGLIIAAMSKGEDIILKGKASEDLVFQLNNDIQTILLIFLPKLKRIKIHADSFSDTFTNSGNVATGFSAGIDSFYTMAEHYYSDSVSPAYKVNHLFYNNVGAHGMSGERLWQQKYQHLKQLPEKLGVPFIGVNSNIQDFYHTFRFIETHTFLNASVGLLFQNGIDKYFYSSAYNYENLEINCKKHVGFADPLLLPNLSTKSINLISLGSSLSRVDKVIRVSQIADTHDFLDVCLDEENEQNCSKCLKCMKTQLALDLIGVLRKYDKVFNHEIYLKNRFRFISLLHRTDCPHLKELLFFARRFNYPIPFSSKVASYSRYFTIGALIKAKLMSL